MSKDIPLGRIAGIKVGMDITVFLVAGLYAIVLAENGLPIGAPGFSTTTYWIAGICGALLIFVSLLVHELGHALVARDEGIEVTSMGLTVFGGVTRMATSPQTPGAEFRVSVVGPIASAACGVVFLVAAVILPNGGIWHLVGDLFAWVGVLNLFLAVLNMVPAAPLDGGKVLSSAIWRFSGNQTTALTWTAGVGIVVGMVAITWGVRELSRSGSGGSFSLTAILVGGFVAYGAYQQLRAAPVYRAVEGLTASSVMVTEPPNAPAWVTVGEFLRTSSPRPEHQAYPVVGTDGQVWGLLTAAAIRAVPPHQWDQLQVTDLAYPLERLTLIHPGEDLLSAFQRLEGGDVRTGLVVGADGRILGTLDLAALDQVLARTKAGMEPVGT